MIDSNDDYLLFGAGVFQFDYQFESHIESFLYCFRYSKIKQLTIQMNSMNHQILEINNLIFRIEQKKFNMQTQISNIIQQENSLERKMINKEQLIKQHVLKNKNLLKFAEENFFEIEFFKNECNNLINELTNEQAQFLSLKRKLENEKMNIKNQIIKIKEEAKQYIDEINKTINQFND